MKSVDKAWCWRSAECARYESRLRIEESANNNNVSV
jgi:hypothetical protein